MKTKKTYPHVQAPQDERFSGLVWLDLKAGRDYWREPMTAAEARKLARSLLDAADKAEVKP